MFKIAVDNLVQSIGEDVYLPSPSTAASQNLAPLSLVEREKGFLPFDRYKNYYTTDFTLQDVLVERGGDFKLQDDQPFCTFNRESTIKVDGSLQGSLKGIFDAEVQKTEEITISAPFGQLNISEVDMQSLLDNLHTRKLNMHHELVRELANKKRRALCLVTGVVKTATEVTITASLNHTIDINLDDSDDEDETPKPKTNATNPSQVVKDVAAAVTAKPFDGDMRGTHEKNSKRTLLLPAGTVVAYQLMELAVNDLGAMRLVVTHNGSGGFHVKSVGKSKGSASQKANCDSDVDSNSSNEYIIWMSLVAGIFGVGIAIALALHWSSLG